MKTRQSVPPTPTSFRRRWYSCVLSRMSRENSFMCAVDLTHTVTRGYFLGFSWLLQTGFRQKRLIGRRVIPLRWGSDWASSREVQTHQLARGRWTRYMVPGTWNKNVLAEFRFKANLWYAVDIPIYYFSCFLFVQLAQSARNEDYCCCYTRP